jgi:hypothetical protein
MPDPGDYTDSKAEANGLAGIRRCADGTAVINGLGEWGCGMSGKYTLKF